MGPFTKQVGCTTCRGNAGKLIHYAVKESLVRLTWEVHGVTVENIASPPHGSHSGAPQSYRVWGRCETRDKHVQDLGLMCSMCWRSLNSIENTYLEIQWWGKVNYCNYVTGSVTCTNCNGNKYFIQSTNCTHGFAISHYY